MIKNKTNQEEMILILSFLSAKIQKKFDKMNPFIQALIIFLIAFGSIYLVVVLVYIMNYFKGVL